jgi:VWFA-related protein
MGPEDMLPGFTRAHRRKYRWPVWVSIIVLAVVPASTHNALHGQTANPQEVSSREVEPSFKLEAERNLVIVRVVVRDATGAAVNGLRKEDFQLFDRGKPQTITQFSVENSAGNFAETTASKPVPGALGPPETARPPAPPHQRYVALYFDDVDTEFGDLANARDAAGRFLGNSLQPGDRVGVFTASGQKPLDFTDDLAKVRQAVAALSPHHTAFAQDEACVSITPYEAYLIVELNDQTALTVATADMRKCGELFNSNSPNSQSQSSTSTTSTTSTTSSSTHGRGGSTSSTPSNTALIVQSYARQVLLQSEAASQAVLRSLDSLVLRMSPLPGQRSIVIVSDGFLTVTLHPNLTQISERALRSNITINALDARGLYIASQLADASKTGPGSLRGDMLLKKENMMQDEAQFDSDGMRTFALDTGGTLFENNNDLEEGFRRTTALSDAIYTLAFSPQNLKHDGAFHSLKVTLVSSKGLSVRARSGYYAPEKTENAAAQEEEELRAAVFAQTEIETLPIQVNPQFFKINQTEAEIDVLARLDLQRLHFRKEGGLNLANLIFVAAVFDRDGNYVTAQQRSLQLRLRDARLERLARTGLKFEIELNVKPGPYVLRTVVRDSESGQISALNREVVIP